ncbi:MAG: hypothetical protein A2046_11355 [Bacteroidetes bacterium GWA2_30_7]|nr:MAG: hypothetical protein A2046_11355 [Bacteroidetes bacterium GWA2_30_7]
MRLTVDINNKIKFNSLVSFLRSNGYKVQIQDDAPLKDEDWCMPGRPATDEEHEAHAIAMENDIDEGTEASIFFDKLISEIKLWK